MRAKPSRNDITATSPFSTVTNFVKFWVIAVAMILASLSPAQVGSGGLVIVGDRTIRESIASTAPLTEFASGQYHTVGLRADGSVVVWGRNAFGQCNVPAGLVGVAHVAAGYDHTILLMKDGTVKCFGLNQYGQCDPPSGLSGVVQVAGGTTHSVALKSDGTVVCWGDHSYGMCTAPTGLSGVVQIAAGANHTLARKSDGSLVAWGSNGSGQLSIPAGPNNFVDIAASAYHSVALRANGTVVAFGSNAYGESNVPSTVTGIVKVACGYVHSIALKADGHAVCWGHTGFGQSNVPDVVLKQIGGCLYDSAGLTLDGHFVGWGESLYGQGCEPNAILNLSKVVSGSGHIAFSRHNGTVGIWGQGNRNQDLPIAASGQIVDLTCGYNHTAVLQANPDNIFLSGDNAVGQTTAFANASGIEKLWAAGDANFALIKNNGGLLASGSNGWGQRAVITGQTKALQITGGNYHATLLRPDGTVVCAGDNTYGQSVPPAGLSGVVQIASGSLNNAALKADGTVVGWGWNNDLQSTPPVGLSGVVQVACGNNHSVALKSNGTVVGWGANYNGQTGIPAGLTGISQIAAGSFYTVCVPRLGFSISPYTVSGGDSATGTVFLTSPAPAGGTKVYLTSNDSKAMPPGVVTVPAGATSLTFAIPTSATLGEGQVAVSASLDGFTQNSLLTVTPAPFTLSINTTSFVGGSTAPIKGSINLLSPAPVGGRVVTLTSSDSSVTLPATVTIPATKTGVVFTITHGAVTTTKTIDVSASSQGFTRTTSLTASPFKITQLTLTPNIALGGYPSLATVTLNAAPAADFSIPFSSSNTTAVPTPSAMVFSAGSKTGTLSIPTNPVLSPVTLTIGTTLNNPLSTTLQVVPVFSSVTLGGPVWYGNGSSLCTVTLTRPAPAGGLTLEIEGTSCSVPSTILVPEGQSQVTFGAVADDVSTSATGTVTVVAKGSSVTVSKPIAVNSLVSITADTASFKGGSTTVATFTVTLKGPVAVDTPISLSSSAPEVVLTPDTLVIPAGQSSATFTVTHFAVTKARTVKIIAVRMGVTKFTNVTVNP